jgi:hypothetical protein
MSAPDHVFLLGEEDIPPRIAGFPHRLALLPVGTAIADLGQAECRCSGIFLIEPDCAHFALSDPAFDHYLKRRLPILVYSRRPRDLRPFLRRSEALKQRGYGVEAVS